jgi:hypothetical protein
LCIDLSLPGFSVHVNKPSLIDNIYKSLFGTEDPLSFLRPSVPPKQTIPLSVRVSECPERADMSAEPSADVIFLHAYGCDIGECRLDSKKKILRRNSDCLDAFSRHCSSGTTINAVFGKHGRSNDWDSDC